MKKLIALLMVLCSLNVFAGDVDDIFGGGEDQFDFEAFSDEDILERVNQDVSMNCTGALCTIHSVTNNYGGFEVSFEVGENLDGNNSGNIIIADGDDGYRTEENCTGDSCLSWGVKVRYAKGQCTQTVNVPKSVYMALNTYMYGLIQEGGGTRRGFTPADEAMIMFYTTVMSKASGCTMQ